MPRPQVTVQFYGHPPFPAVVPPRWFWRLFPPQPFRGPCNCMARTDAVPAGFGAPLVPGFRGFWSDEAAALLWQREHKWWRVIGRWALAGTVGLVTVVAFFTAVLFVAYLVHP
jgi:hypothetical protein